MDVFSSPTAAKDMLKVASFFRSRWFDFLDTTIVHDIVVVQRLTEIIQWERKEKNGNKHASLPMDQPTLLDSMVCGIFANSDR